MYVDFSEEGNNTYEEIDRVHRVLFPIPITKAAAEAGRSWASKKISVPTGITERYSQTISIMRLLAPLPNVRSLYKRNVLSPFSAALYLCFCVQEQG
jgi:hypothetical protein